MWGTNQFVLLKVESLQFTASFRQCHHAFVCDTVALTQVDVLQFTTVLTNLKSKEEEKHLTQTINEMTVWKDEHSEADSVISISYLF